MKTALVIGAGVSGLASALRLQSKGYIVTIVEKNSFLGGKTSILRLNDTSFNLTATIPVLFQNFIDLFEDIGEDYKDYLTINNLETIYKAFFINSEPLEISSNLNLLSKNFSNVELKEYLLLLCDAKEKYTFMQNNFLNTKSKISLKKMINLIKLRPSNSPYKYFKDNLSNIKLVKALTFQSMYVGTSPFEGPSIFSILPLINNINGLVNIEGGIHSFIKALNTIFIKRGGKYLFNSSVKSFTFKENYCTGVLLDSNIELTSSLIISSIDFPYTLQNLIPSQLTRKSFPFHFYEKDEMSCSTFILYLTLNKNLSNLNTHNIFINKNFKDSINSSFSGKIPKNPSLYVYKSSSDTENINLNIIMRVPNLLYLPETFWTFENISKIEEHIIFTLEEFLKLRNLSSCVINKHSMTPVQFKTLFNNHAGSCFGIIPNISNLDFLRPQCKIKNLENLYFVGDSIHPGSGISTVLTSVKIAINEAINNK